MFRTDELVIDLHHGIRRQREAHAGIGTGFGKDRGVDANHFTGHVDQRPAGVARIDRGIGLNKRLEVAAGNNFAAFGGDDACSNRLLQAKGTAHGEHPVAHLHAVGIAQLSGR